MALAGNQLADGEAIDGLSSEGLSSDGLPLSGLERSGLAPVLSDGVHAASAATRASRAIRRFMDVLLG